LETVFKRASLTMHVPTEPLPKAKT